MAVMLQKEWGLCTRVYELYGISKPAEEDYAEGAWVSYDVGYCQQAAACQNTTWAKVNLSLFSLCFTGKAQALSQCDLCLSSSHGTRECIWAGEGSRMCQRVYKPWKFQWNH